MTATLIAAFDADTRDAMEKSRFDAQIGRLDRTIQEEAMTDARRRQAGALQRAVGQASSISAR